MGINQPVCPKCFAPAMLNKVVKSKFIMECVCCGYTWKEEPLNVTDEKLKEDGTKYS